jgi:hypothetical protein
MNQSAREKAAETSLQFRPNAARADRTTREGSAKRSPRSPSVDLLIASQETAPGGAKVPVGKRCVAVDYLPPMEHLTEKPPIKGRPHFRLAGAKRILLFGH